MRAWTRWAAPLAVLAVLALAALLRLWALGRPSTLVFDEIYYVRDAISQLAHGFPTVWPDDDPSMAGARATAFGAEASNAVHPPLGKWLIGLGILVFGPESGWGWRSAAALSGVATVGIVMRLGWLMSRSMVVACTAGLLLAVDGVHVVLSRVGLLDGFLATAIALGALFVWRDQLALAARAERCAPDRPLPVWWGRPWLLAAAAAFGAAAAIKWSGLYPLACFLILVTVRDLLARLRRRDPRAVLRAVGQAAASAALTLPTAALVYLASWAGWIIAPGGWAREPGVPWPVSLLAYHREMLGWHSTLSAPHPYQSHPLSWPLALRPTAMYEQRSGIECAAADCVAAVSPLPNPLVTWGGVIALGVLVWLIVRALRGASGPAARHAVPGGGSGAGAVPGFGSGIATALPLPFATAAAFVVTGYLSGWLPWVATVSRSAVFQFYAVVLTPFSALALALVLGVLCRVGALGRAAELPGGPGAQGLGLRPLDAAELLGRRGAAAVFLALAVALGVFFFPLWSGMPVPEWFWRAHLWLPGWD